MKPVLTLLILLATGFSLAKAQPLPNAHSHNDYNQAVPFHHAYNSGFGSIEADVYLRHGRLLVAHDTDKLNAGHTLKKMYLKPLKKALKKDTSRRVTLLIDDKEDYSTILPELIKELKPLKKYLKGYKHNGRLQILISGNRPDPSTFGTYPDYIFFDEDLRQNYTPEELIKIGQVSLKYSKYSEWKGVGPISDSDAQRIKAVIDSVHAFNKPIRFWDAPDNPAGWTELLKLHADIIGTDKIDELAAFLRNKTTLTSASSK